MANLITNPDFTSNNDSWTAAVGDCTITNVAGGQSGNCLSVAGTGAGAWAYCYQMIAATPFLRYKIRVYAKDGTEIGGRAIVNVYDGTRFVTGNTMLTTSTWNYMEVHFIAPISGNLTFAIGKSILTTTILFDTISVEADSDSAGFNQIVIGTQTQNELSNAAFGLWSNASVLLPADTGYAIVLPNAGFANTTDLTAVDCTIASVAGGQAGNCLQITRTGGDKQSAYQTVVIATGGRIFRIGGYFKSGTSGNEACRIEIYTDADVLTGGVDLTSSSEWQTSYFDVQLYSGTYKLYVTKNTSTAGTMLFDSLYVNAIEPGYEALADVKSGPDGWIHYGAASYIRRETYGTNIKDGCMYSLYFVPSSGEEGVVSSLRFPAMPYPANYPLYSNLTWWYRFRGKTITFGCWIVSPSSKAGVQIVTSTDTITKYHSGSNAWEWVEVTTTPVVEELNYLYVALITEGGTGNKYAHFAQPILAFAPFIGEGNSLYTKPEIIHLTTKIALYTNITVSGSSSIVVPTVTSLLPRNMKAVQVNMTGQCGTAGKYVDIYGLRMYFPVADKLTSIQGWVPLWAGDLEGFVIATDDTVTNLTVNIISVELF